MLHRYLKKNLNNKFKTLFYFVNYTLGGSYMVSYRVVSNPKLNIVDKQKRHVNQETKRPTHNVAVASSKLGYGMKKGTIFSFAHAA